jgi:hypothetical protein
VVDVSADGEIVLFHDAGTFDPLYIWDDEEVRPIADPSYEAGSPVFGRLSPMAAFVVFDDSGSLFRFNVGSGQVASVPATTGLDVSWYVFTSESSLAVLSNVSADSPVPPTQLWSLDLDGSTATPLGTRTDSNIVYATSRGIVVQVDMSANHDGSHLALYLVDHDGSDSLLYDAGQVDSLAVSSDGAHVAFSSSASDLSGSWIVTLSSGDRLRLDAGGTIWSFSPDDRHVAVRFADGRVTSYGVDGSEEMTQPDGDHVAWVGKP